MKGKVKRLTVNHLALASLRARRREYAALAVGIMLAVSLVFTLLFTGSSLLAAKKRALRDLVGNQDALVFDVAEKDISRLPQEMKVGTITLVGEAVEEELSIGFYDDLAAGMMNRRLVAGRMPEHADEIAMSRGALARMRLDEALDQTIPLMLSPFTDGARVPQAREFILVGVLADQVLNPPSEGKSISWTSHNTDMPEGLVAPQAPVPGSRAVIHWAIQLPRGMGMRPLMQALEQQQMDAWRMKSFVFSLEAGRPDTWQDMLLMALLIVSLLLCACIAVLNAFSNRLKQREQQIGMLRAVGATARQIRSIYAREALLIALITAPMALALSLGASALLLHLTTGAPLAIPPAAIPVGLAASMLVILLAATVPLVSAGRLPPLLVIRDARLMRARRRLKVTSRLRYNPARLLANRAMRFNRRSLTGISLLIALSMLCTALLVSFFYWTSWSGAEKAELPGFRLYRSAGWAMTSHHVMILSRSPGLEAVDIDRLGRLPGVRRLTYSGLQEMMLLVDTPTAYQDKAMQTSVYDTGLTGEDMVAFGYTPEQVRQTLDMTRKDYEQLQAALGTRATPKQVAIVVMDPARLQAMAPYVTQGRLDMARIAAGEEWLMVAADVYYGTEKGASWSASRRPETGTWDGHVTNDGFRAGDMLDVRQQYIFQDEDRSSADDALAIARKRQALRPIGALIDGESFNRMPVGNDIAYSAVTLLTVPEGLQAMGLYPGGIDSVEVYLSGTPTPEEEAYLEQEIGAIALRDPNMTAYNVMAGKREQQRTSVQVVLMFAGLLMVFFALSLGLINNHLTGRLRAERRAIGSLRALGADRSVLYNSYARQLVRMMLFGAIPGIAVSAALVIQQGMNRYNSFPPRYYLLLAGLECALILLMFGFSALHLRRLVGAVLRQSVISQIREAG